MTSEPERGSREHRIVALVDDSGVAASVLEAAVELAARRGVSAVGLFVEEADLLQAAGFPFAHEVGLTTAGLRRLSPEQLQADMRARAERVRSHMAELAERNRVAWHFQVARGRPPAEIRALATAADWLVLGHVGRSRRHGVLLGGTASGLAADPPCPALFMPAGPAARLGSGVAVACTEFDEATLERALELRRTTDEPVIPLLADGVGPERNAAVAWLRQRGADVRPYRCGAFSARSLADALGRSGARLLVVGDGEPHLRAAASQLLAGARWPVMLAP